MSMLTRVLCFWLQGESVCEEAVEGRASGGFCEGGLQWDRSCRPPPPAHIRPQRHLPHWDGQPGRGNQPKTKEDSFWPLHHCKEWMHTHTLHDKREKHKIRLQSPYVIQQVLCFFHNTHISLEVQVTGHLKSFHSCYNDVVPFLFVSFSLPNLWLKASTALWCVKGPTTTWIILNVTCEYQTLRPCSQLQ